MYRRYQFLAKVTASRTGELFESLPRNDAVAKPCSCKSNVTFYRDQAGGLNLYHHHYHHLSFSVFNQTHLVVDFQLFMVVQYITVS
jgi:hypothetical protein